MVPYSAPIEKVPFKEYSIDLHIRGGRKIKIRVSRCFCLSLIAPVLALVVTLYLKGLEHGFRLAHTYRMKELP